MKIGDYVKGIMSEPAICGIQGKILSFHPKDKNYIKIEGYENHWWVKQEFEVIK